VRRVKEKEREKKGIGDRIKTKTPTGNRNALKWGVPKGGSCNAREKEKDRERREVSKEREIARDYWPKKSQEENPAPTAAKGERGTR